MRWSKILVTSLLMTFFILGFFRVTSILSAQEPEDRKIRVLVFYGGHPFNMEDFKHNFDGADNMEVYYAKLPEGRDMLAPGLEKQYDVLVMFDMDQVDPTPEQRKKLYDLLDKGIGYFAFHHNLCSVPEWDEYYDITGGKTFLNYFFEGKDHAMFRGQPYEFSTFQMLPISFKVADKDHPIMNGVVDFDLNEEAYGKALVNPNVHVLLTSESPGMTHEVAWTWHYNNSPVFGTFLGHDINMWSDENFHKMFLQAIKWLADQTWEERAKLAQ